MCFQKVENFENQIVCFVGFLKVTVMPKIAGSGSRSGSISLRHGSADPDPDSHQQNVMDSQHWFKGLSGAG
jgi:hypothetical protein